MNVRVNAPAYQNQRPPQQVHTHELLGRPRRVSGALCSATVVPNFLGQPEQLCRLPAAMLASPLSSDASPLGHGEDMSQSIRAARESSMKKHVHHHVLSDREEAIMNKFEALDYDFIENKIFEREQLLADANDTKRFAWMTWLVFFLIGAGTGTTAFLIDTGVSKLLELRWGYTYDALIGVDAGCTDDPVECGVDADSGCGCRTCGDKSDDNPWQAFFIDVLMCGAYVAVASGLVVWVEPAAAGSGIPDMKGYLNGTNLRGALTCKALVAKAVGVVFAVGGGLCVGKEGPLVHAGSVLGANISHGFDMCTARFKRWNSFRNDALKRDFVSGGCAAGVAAAFGAPMGGVLFAFEEASSFWSLPLTWKCFFCAATSTFTLNFWLSSLSCEGVVNGIDSASLITFGTFKDSPYALRELPIFAGLAVVGGLLGALFNQINQALSVWRRDRDWPKWQKQAECILTAMLTGAVFFILPRFFNDKSNCRPLPSSLDAVHNTREFYNQYECQDGYYNPMASLSFAGQEQTIHGFFHGFTNATVTDHTKPEFVYDTATCVVYMLAYFALAVWTYGIQVPSGLFVPGIIIGCSFGRLTGEWVRYHTYDAQCGSGDVDMNDPAMTALHCHTVHPGVYAFLGATCMLGGMTRMTISLCVILMETTNNIQYLLPIMMTLSVSKWVGDWFNISLYDMHVEIKCIPFLEGKPPVGMEQLHAGDLMKQPVMTFNEVESAETVYCRLEEAGHNGFPVLRTGTRKFVGTVLRSQLIVLMKLQAFCGPEGLRNPARFTQVEFSSSTGGGALDDEVDCSWFGGVQVTSHDFATKLQSTVDDIHEIGVSPSSLAGKYLDMRPIMNPRPFSVGEETSLVRVYRLCRAMGIRHLPVVNIDNEVVGILTRKELRADFSQDLY
jgi:chloride channel 7